MNDTAFIELAIKYLDTAADTAEIEQLSATMLDNPERRALYRELVQQSQLAHEWDPRQAAPSNTRRPITRLAIITAAAAAIILTLFSTNLWQSTPPTPGQLVTNTEQSGSDNNHDPSWQAIYPSIFDQPIFVWRAEFSTDTSASETPDVFSENGMPPAPATTLKPEFSQRIEPIAMLPGGLF